MADLAEDVPSIEIYSIDEAFCDFTGIADPKALATHLRHKVWRNQRIPMGVSVAPTKTLSKLGQYATKKISRLQGVCVLAEPSQWQWLAARTPVSEVWGVGRRLTIKLEAMGVDTALDLANLNFSAARDVAGVTLERTVRELQGVACIDIELMPTNKQQIISSRSFGSKVTTLPPLLQAVSAHAERAAEKLRHQQSYAGRLSVSIQTGHFIKSPLLESHSVSIAGGTDDPRRLSFEAVDIARRLFRPGVAYAKAGVILLDIRPINCWQGDLLEPNSLQDNAELLMAIDKIKQRFGSRSIKLARQGSEALWAMKREMLSPNYLGDLSQAVTIKC